MSAKLISKVSVTKMPARSLLRGQLAIVDDSTTPLYNGQIVMRTYKGLVSLSDGRGLTWRDGCTLEVLPLPLGTVVEITSEV